MITRLRVLSYKGKPEYVIIFHYYVIYNIYDLSNKIYDWFSYFEPQNAINIVSTKDNRYQLKRLGVEIEHWSRIKGYIVDKIYIKNANVIFIYQYY